MERNAFIKDADRRGVDDTVTQDQMKQWAGICEAESK
jgi:hypothetical protein